MSVLILSENGKLVPKPSLAAAIADADCAGKTVVITGNVPIAADVTTLGNIGGIKIEAGGLFTIASGATLTIDVPFNCGLMQCFSLADDTAGVVFESGSVSEVYPEWWGVDGVDDTAAIQAAMDASKKIFISNGTWKVKDLVPNTGQHIVFESEDAILSGVAVTDNIFGTSTFTQRVTIEGGTFKNCAAVWEHTGNSALAYSKFIGMNILDCTSGFDLTTSIGNTWQKCLFGSAGVQDNIDYGVYFRCTGTGQTNVNSFVDCSFLLFAVNGILWADVSGGVKVGNYINRCWFEDGSGTAIYIGGATNKFVVSETYFETNAGTSDLPDIHMVSALGGPSRSVDIRDCVFATPKDNQTCRILSEGNTSFNAYNNSVNLKSTTTVFAKVNSGSSFHSTIHENYLNALGGGEYETRLYSRSGTAQVSWSLYTGSGYVTSDDKPYRYTTGAEGYEIVSLDNTGTPSVQGVRLCSTGGTTAITELIEGRVGQLITIIAAYATRITSGTTIKLTSTNFDMAVGDTLTLVQSEDNVWRETARSGVQYSYTMRTKNVSILAQDTWYTIANLYLNGNNLGAKIEANVGSILQADGVNYSGSSQSWLLHRTSGAVIVTTLASPVYSVAGWELQWVAGASNNYADLQCKRTAGGGVSTGISVALTITYTDPNGKTILTNGASSV